MMAYALLTLAGCSGPPPDDIIDKPVTPKADAGFDRTVASGERVYLNGRINTGGNFSYAWTQLSGPPVNLNDASSPQTYFLASEVGTCELQLTVSINDLSDSDTVVIHVTEKGTDLPPIANAGADRIVKPGIVVEIDGRASYDPGGGTLSYKWRQIEGPNVTISNSESAVASFTSPAVTKSTKLSFELYVRNAKYDAVDTVTLTVSPTAQLTQYNLAVLTKVGGSVTPNQGAFDEGVSVSVKANAYNGWKFDHWEGDLTDSINPGSLTFDKNKFITAVFVKRQYSLTTKTTGQGTVNPWQGTYDAFSEVILTATPANAQWKFDRWEGDIQSGSNPLTVTMDSDKAITGCFVEVGQVSSPSFDPPASILFSGAVDVTITSATSGASIYYTVDGADPVKGVNLYTQPIPVTKTTTIKAQAFKAGMVDSEIITAEYHVMVVPAGKRK